MEAPVSPLIPTSNSTVAPDPKAAKRANYELYLANVAAGSLEATNKPVQLFLEVSSRCNLRCKKCGFAWDPSLAASGQDLPWPILSRMDDFFAAAVEVYTFGYGEMFLYPDLAPLVTVLKNHGCRLSGVTNGVLIRPADVVWLVATGYDHLAFSIDGGTEETMQKLRGASLAKVLRALQLIHEEKQRRKSKLAEHRRQLRGPERQHPGAPGARAPALAPRDLLPRRQPAAPLLRHSGALRSLLRGVSARARSAGRSSRRSSRSRAIAAEAAGMIFQNFVNPDFEWQEEAPPKRRPSRSTTTRCPRPRARPRRRRSRP